MSSGHRYIANYIRDGRRVINSPLVQFDVPSERGENLHVLLATSVKFTFCSNNNNDFIREIIQREVLL